MSKSSSNPLTWLFSSKLALALLLIYAIAIGGATFVENSYSTITAKVWIYNTWWFELLHVLLVINFIGHVFRHKLLDLKKTVAFLFHLGFIVCIVGAGITRYYGFEGMMPIREGETTNIMYSLEPYLQVNAVVGEEQKGMQEQIYLTPETDNTFSYRGTIAEKSFEVGFHEFIPNAKETIEEYSAEGKDILEIVIANSTGRIDEKLEEGSSRALGGVVFHFNTAVQNPAEEISIVSQDEELMIRLPFAVERMQMPSMEKDVLRADTLAPLKLRTLYQASNGFQFVVSKKYEDAVIKVQSSDVEGEDLPDLVTLQVSTPEDTSLVTLKGGNGRIPVMERFLVGDILFSAGYGSKVIELPFSIHCNDFILDHYPGSQSPSSYKSKLTFFDERRALAQPVEIFMNNVHDYDGFRFFQASYDKDLKGTRLSVNNDSTGTVVSYSGYGILFLGMLLSLFVSQGRFRMLANTVKQSSKSMKAFWYVFLLFSGGIASAQSSEFVPKEHADKFGNLVVQSYDGRFQPVHTLARDVVLKIHKGATIGLEDGTDITPAQFLLDALIHVDYWKRFPMIHLGKKAMRNALDTEDKYMAYETFFGENGQYTMRAQIEEAHRKKAIDQLVVDKEIIKLDERVNVFRLALQGHFLRIFPDEQSATKTWFSPVDSAIYNPIEPIAEASTPLPEVTYEQLFQMYIVSLVEARESGDYTLPDQIVSTIASLQERVREAHGLPDKDTLRAEIWYHSFPIFQWLMVLYLILAVVLLFSTVGEILTGNSTYRALWSKVTKAGTVTLFIGLCVHLFGMALRWYITGHAPWSNGYEALLMISLSGLIGGFIFMRYSKVTLAATSLLAFFVLLSALISDYDPQLTNLEPVLQSYWLIIHVAVITSSYGFFGLSFILGLILLVFHLRKEKDKQLRKRMQEISAINEMSMTVGVVLATIGTFLGGIWANESWGRYWGWDAKETWALVIVLVYAMILHFRFIPKLKNVLTYSLAAVWGFSTVLMTFFGVNYYLSKGLHSYARGEAPVFPVWAWFCIGAILLLSILAIRRTKKQIAHY